MLVHALDWVVAVLVMGQICLDELDWLCQWWGPQWPVTVAMQMPPDSWQLCGNGGDWKALDHPFQLVVQVFLHVVELWVE